MLAELFPFLTNIERDLEGLSTRESNPLWRIGKTARNARINATITNFDRQLNAASTDDLTAYAEGLKPHLQRAMAYRAGDIWTDYQSTIADCHKHFCFAFFALILRAYDNKKLFIDASEYAASAGIEDFAALSSEVCQAANDWGIFHTPTIAELLAEKRQGRIQGQPQPKEYDLLSDYPAAETYLSRLVPDYLNDDYALQDKTSKADAAIIAYTIAEELGISKVCKYFEHFWNITDLAGARQQVKTRADKSSIREVLRCILRKKVQGTNAETEDTEKADKYLKQYS